MIDIKAIFEGQFESFLNTCINNPLMEHLIWDEFSNPTCYSKHFKENHFDTTPYEICFERLYDWDADYLFNDPMNCLIDWMEQYRKLEG